MQARHWLGLAAGILLATTACGPPKQAGTSNTPSTESEYGESPSDVSDDEMDRDVVDPDLIEFDEEQAQVVLKRGAKKATECAKVTEGAPSGEVDVEVIFDGKTGQIIEVIPGTGINSAEDDNATNCIKRSFMGEIIPPFKGRKNVTHSFTMP
jgi:hypothetical protein